MSSSGGGTTRGRQWWSPSINVVFQGHERQLDARWRSLVGALYRCCCKQVCGSCYCSTLWVVSVTCYVDRVCYTPCGPSHAHAIMDHVSVTHKGAMSLSCGLDHVRHTPPWTMSISYIRGHVTVMRYEPWQPHTTMDHVNIIQGVMSLSCDMNHGSHTPPWIMSISYKGSCHCHAIWTMAGTHHPGSCQYHT